MIKDTIQGVPWLEGDKVRPDNIVKIGQSYLSAKEEF